MAKQYDYLIGVDGGGTGTRVVVADSTGIELARGAAGASGLINGSAPAWQAILSGMHEAFSKLNRAAPALARMAIGMGLAGVHNKQWAANFIGENPGFGAVSLETDAFTTLLGAHHGQPGVIIAIGTGSAGESLSVDGVRCEVGGWGFPCGDEAGGAWLGLKAINHLQQVLDGRVARSEFSDALLGHCGGHRDALFNWLANANQGSYAKIAPLVVEYASQHQCQLAVPIMQSGAQEIVKIALALDGTETLPVALCGGLGQVYRSYLPDDLANRLVAARGDSAAGALLLIQKALETKTC